MTEPQPRDVTMWLQRMQEGDADALNQLLPLVYDEMRALAASHMKRERASHTLQPTALVHEAYMRLVRRERPDWNDRSHFMAVASQVIRRILVDHARGKHREKRGGEALRITLSEQAISAPAIDLDLLALDQALTRLGAEDELAQKVVELRFFGGMTTPEIAGVLATSERTIERRWAYAKAWLHKALDLG